MPDITVAPMATTRPNARHRLLLLLKAGRPRQWSKNLLTFLAATLAGAGLSDAVKATVAMTAAAVAVYLYNDVRDRDEDRRDPAKARRPIASGALPVADAVAASAVLAIAALVAAGPGRIAVGAYLIVNAVYSFGAKKLPFIEAILVGASFPLRALTGAAHGQDEPAVLLLASIWLAAIGVIAAKRQGELHERHDARNVNRHYTPRMLSVVRAASFVTATALTGVTSGPWAATGMALAFARLHQKAGRGQTARPDEIALKDPLTLVGAALWAAGLLL